MFYFFQNPQIMYFYIQVCLLASNLPRRCCSLANCSPPLGTLTLVLEIAGNPWQDVDVVACMLLCGNLNPMWVDISGESYLKMWPWGDTKGPNLH